MPLFLRRGNNRGGLPAFARQVVAYPTREQPGALKAGFTSLLDILGMGLQQRLLRRVALKVWKRLNARSDFFDENNIPSEVLPKIEQMARSVGETLVELSLGVLPTPPPGSGLRRDVKWRPRRTKTQKRSPKMATYEPLSRLS